MRINIRLVAVRRPPRVPQAYVVFVPAAALDGHPFDAVAAEAVAAGEFGADEMAALRVDGHYAAGVVAARLQDLETLDADFTRERLVSDVAHDAATIGGR